MRRVLFTTFKPTLALGAVGAAFGLLGSSALASPLLADQNVFGKVKSVTATTVVITHITTGRAVSRSTLTYKIVGTHFTAASTHGAPTTVTASYLKPGDLVDGFSAVSAALTAKDELAGIPVPLKTLEDLRPPAVAPVLTLFDLAVGCELTQASTNSTCGGMMWGTIASVSGTHVTLRLAGGKHATINTALAAVVGGEPPTPFTLSSSNVGNELVVLSPLSYATLNHDILVGTLIPVTVVEDLS